MSASKKREKASLLVVRKSADYNEKLPKVIRDRTKSEEQLKTSKEREKKIDNTIDLVAHDLVSKGHMSPGKSYLLKTKEMKEHIGRMHDKLTKRQEAEEKARARSLKVPRQKGTKKPSSSNKKTQPPDSAIHVVVPVKTYNRPAANADNKSKTETIESPPSRNDSTFNETTTESVVLKPPELPKSPKDIGKHNFPDQTKLSEVAHVGLKSAHKKRNIPLEPFSASIDFAGFTNDEITLDLNGRRLTIVAQEGRKGSVNKRKLTEVLDIPSSVSMQDIRIGRRSDGILVIEELGDKKE